MTAAAEPRPAPGHPPLHVVATAGHVDHGKSSLIIRLTGMDPDRWAEEKRRGLTIDLGFAWAELPSGREIGFVDVPGHERFVRNMLAGVGPVRLVLFVVAADEGWKPQSEEHLAIVDVLGAAAGVVALTKSDLVDDDTLAIREEEARERLAGTALAEAPIIRCSSASGKGLDELRAALDDMIAAAPAPEDAGRPRLYIDRSFSIRGAGTVVTGTLTGGSLAVGDEVEIYPGGTMARIRSLQTHRRPVQTARPVSRVAANLAGTTRDQAERGDVLGRPRQWRSTRLIEARLKPVRGLGHPLTARGAYKLHVGSAERDARLRLHGVNELAAGGSAYARLRLSRPIVAAVGDRFVLREAGRRETVAGGIVLDADPPLRSGSAPEHRLRRREEAAPGELASVVVAERGAIRAADLQPLIGASPRDVPGAVRVGGWWVSGEVAQRSRDTVTGMLADTHRAEPHRPGIDAAEIRRAMVTASPAVAPALEQGLAAELLAMLEREGAIAREGNLVRLAAHRVSLGNLEPEAQRLVAAVEGGEPTPPDVKELERAGFGRAIVEACVRTRRLARVSPDIVVSPGFLARAEEVARQEAAKPEGLTVSRFREVLGTTRKYALPLLTHLDERGLTRRDGDVRRPGPAAGEADAGTS